MLHRSLATFGVAVLALALAAPALAVRVHVRVEGARTTIFGATEPRLTPVTGTITPPSGPAVTVEAETPFGALEAASRAGEFFYRIESFSFGPYVAQIGRLPGTATTGWVYKVNGVSPPVSATAYELKAGDRVLWYHATFGSTGGPKTVDLRLSFTHFDCLVAPCPGAREVACLGAFLVDDTGRRTPARGVVFHVDGRRTRPRAGFMCLDRHWHRAWAAVPGAVRSAVIVAPLRFQRGPTGGASLAGRAG